MALQTVNQYLKVTETALAETGALNAIIKVDNKFFIEPRLLFHSKIPFFADSAAKIEAYFERVVHLIRASKAPKDLAWNAAHRMLQFREPQGFALGYGVNRPNGRGVGPTLAAELLYRAKQILKWLSPRW